MAYFAAVQVDYWGFPKFFSSRQTVANLPNLSNLPGHMNESSHLIGRLLGYFYKHDPFMCVKMLNMSNR